MVHFELTVAVQASISYPVGFLCFKILQCVYRVLVAYACDIYTQLRVGLPGNKRPSSPSQCRLNFLELYSVSVRDLLYFTVCFVLLIMNDWTDCGSASQFFLLEALVDFRASEPTFH